MDQKAPSPLLFPGERFDRVNDEIGLIQKENGLTFGTDAYLLSCFVRKSPSSFAVDLGSGTGILPLLLLAKKKVRTVGAVELQPSFCELITRNAALNGMEQAIHPLQKDVRDLSPNDFSEAVDVVVSNPPYMTVGSGERNQSDEKYLARHEVAGNIRDFCFAAKRILRYGGSFYTVFRPDRISDFLSALRECGLEPKRMTFVHADRNAEPCMLLTEAKYGAAPSVRVTPPLFLYTEESANAKKRTLTEQANNIYQSGLFPEIF